MKEIDTISLDRLNNGAHFLFISNICTRAKADTAVKNKVPALVTALEEALAQEDANLKLSQKSLLTDKIAEADDRRDTLYAGYKKTVNGFRGFPTESIAEAAGILWQHIKDYGINPRMQLDKESGLLTNFIADLEGKYAAQVTTLSLTPFVEKLREANDEVCSLTKERTEERMTRVVGALRTSRQASDTAYRNLVKMVNALALVEGEATYADFIDYVNTEIVHYKREVIGQRASAPVTTPGEEGGEEGSEPISPGSGSSDDGEL